MRSRLAAMMFFQYFILGLWSVTLPTFLMASPLVGGLGFSGKQVGLLYITHALAGSIAPFLVGLLADRFFAAQKVLATLHGLGAVMLFLVMGYSSTAQHRTLDRFYTEAARVTVDDTTLDRYLAPERQADRLADLSAWNDFVNRAKLPWYLVGFSESSPAPDPLGPALRAGRIAEQQSSITEIFCSEPLQAASRTACRDLFILLLLNALCYMPTVPLTTAIALRNLDDPVHQFGHVRVVGTFGWLVAGMVVGLFLNPVSPVPLGLAGVSAITLALYSLALPDTPPTHEGKSLTQMLGLPALKMFTKPAFRTFVGVTLVTTLLTSFHNIYLNRSLLDYGLPRAAAWQTVGQWVEIGCILAIPYVRGRIGLKRMMLLGLVASVIRFGLYSWGNLPWLVAVGIPMHGICYSFYFITAAVFVDTVAPRGLRASAQGLVSLLTLGVGAVFGNWVAGAVVDHFRDPAGVRWAAVWAVPAVGSALTAGWFAWRFREPSGPVD